MKYRTKQKSININNINLRKNQSNKNCKLIKNNKDLEYEYVKKIVYILSFYIIIYLTINIKVFARDPSLIEKLYSAFSKIKNYIVRLSTPAAGVAISSGLIMRKFSFGDEERVRTSKKLIRGSIFAYAFIICIDLVLSLIQLLVG